MPQTEQCNMLYAVHRRNDVAKVQGISLLNKSIKYLNVFNHVCWCYVYLMVIKDEKQGKNQQRLKSALVFYTDVIKR